MDLDATDEQLDCPFVMASARSGYASLDTKPRIWRNSANEAGPYLAADEGIADLPSADRRAGSAGCPAYW